MKIIDGKKIAEKIKDDLASSVFAILNDKNRRPGLAIILVGDRVDSKLYISLKEKAAKEVGVDTSLYLIDKDESEKNIIEAIKFLNQDESIDGILIQLPLPDNFDTDKIIKIISPEKNVDGFSSDKKMFFSPLILALKYSLEDCQQDLKGAQAFLFYNSEIFKNEVQGFLEEQGIKFSGISSKELFNLNKKELDVLAEKVRSNKLLISAMGRAEFIDKKFFSDDMILLDVGISKEGQKVLGDLRGADTKGFKGYFTPVPGGIGPITVACLLKNVILSFLNKK